MNSVDRPKLSSSASDSSPEWKRLAMSAPRSSYRWRLPCPVEVERHEVPHEGGAELEDERDDDQLVHRLGVVSGDEHDHAGTDRDQCGHSSSTIHSSYGQAPTAWLSTAK